MIIPLFMEDDGAQPIYSPYSSVAIAFGAQGVNRSSVAALAFLVWDILITLDDEIHFMWPRRWSYMKCSYFFVRYTPVLVQISILFVGTELTPSFHFTSQDCYIWQIYQGVVSAVVVAIVDIILILRIYALYHNRRVVKCVVGFFYFLELVGMTVGLVLALPGIIFDDLCVVISIPRTLIIYAASAISFQYVLFGLTLYKFIQVARSEWGKVPVLALLVRDGTWAFFLLFFVYIGNIILYFMPLHATFSGVLYGWLMTSFSFSGYRILLNLNKASRHTGESRHSSTRRAVTPIRFSSPINELSEVSDM